ncbi:teichoic acid ABC transporter ATP-binding protein [Flavimobilis marinus]|uniref:Teichoic acid transport system ATP-binding protein n=1 Tax=Flavimobilis marinus TaxID=285351 RepID=A0A1I2HIS6_9MICO|nr:ABC transporter ATP-binding protein [Flavimobilis marinus]GHG57407.1 teichoic acid ABC transporter ATP-binding protein [Flavimobilis marinus]SFF29190.1 teichoic acid transport system ATP-binding protein [Flavimobilis marinus]
MSDTEFSAEEIDFEVDAEDLPDAPASQTPLGAPSVIVDDLHVSYRVFGSRGRPARGAAQPSRVQRLITKARGMDPTAGVTEVKAVRGVSFVARHGESIGIVGTNGSGKSTLLRALAGLIPPAAGTVYVSGTPSLLGVNAVLMKQLTGERNIMIGGLALGLSVKEVTERFDEIVDFAGIGDFVYLPMKAYSAGMSARLRFAISTAATPDILMIDEALATGDAAFRQKSRERIDEIRQQAGTIFLVSHSLASVKAMCNRVIWLDKGQIRMDGDVETVARAYRRFTRSGGADD